METTRGGAFVMPRKLVQYAELLGQIKQRIRQGQARAVLSANAELILTYWDIGRMILERQTREGWGASVIPRLSRDLYSELPEVKGFSERNIKRMLAWYREYSAAAFVPQAVAQIKASVKVPQVAAQTESQNILQRLVAKNATAHMATTRQIVPGLHQLSEKIGRLT